ncbi:hypothetical protein [Faecalispora anaeroviscerum]|uniref:hypothetical protein n=1 Tax=Faecalispora anaeroviscerum TaxID=2991836 RepID=UPI0024BA24BB|nr:hypothetical protein [Faecalispora anaeroviscerum]
MRAKVLIFLIVTILSASLIGCSNESVLKNQNDGTTINTVQEQDRAPTADDEVKEDDNINLTNSTEPFVGRMALDSETEKFFYGTWKVEKLLGFANSYNDASEYPTGQKIIDDEIVINKDLFSSKGLKNYSDYQYILKNPLYEITIICYNEDDFYRNFKMDLLGINMDDEIKEIQVSDSSTGFGIPIGFLVVNNDSLILELEATCFKLKRVTD